MLSRICRSALLLLSVVGAANAQDVQPPPEEGTAYVVGFIEVFPRATDAVTTALRAYRDAGRQREANLDFQVFQEIGQQNRFMVTQTWREEAAYHAYVEGEAALRLRDTLAAVQLGPPDVRVHRAFTIGAPATAGTDMPAAPSSAIYVQAHLDVVPPLFSGLVSLLGPFVEESRADGALHFNLLQHVAPRQNHLTLMEAWRTEADLNAHRMAAHTREFRQGIHPLLGSLYDERLYRLVD